MESVLSMHAWIYATRCCKLSSMRLNGWVTTVPNVACCVNGMPTLCPWMRTALLLLHIFYSKACSISEVRSMSLSAFDIASIQACRDSICQYTLLTVMFKDYQELIWSNTTMLKSQGHRKVIQPLTIIYFTHLHTKLCVHDGKLGLLLQHRAADSPMHTTIQTT